ncbi:6-phosphogluconate dehydratase [Arboricoccus pini]|uniref:Phosphogluconate dehydratase n=1 Tax=Arboricoccus pini TaxID=1963835 RepID=A0A212PVV2_9PROT|nr:phosphogluconate dehydratase [Arboricoccus pini]SNB51109.1 6-phosphogluconate dehydratase [Arboricoccus pini]
MGGLNARIGEVTERIARRSQESRARYLERIMQARTRGPQRARLDCGNLAHAFAACDAHDKDGLKGDVLANIGIVTSYNDMLSAHEPYRAYPDLIKAAVREAGAIAQVAGGVPAMCDGVTQGQAGMELSLFSRDVIAMAAAIALSHDVFDGALFLGICDKIVPGLVVAALSFGHLPAIFVPAGPMPSGIPNEQKAKVRKLFAEGKVSRAELLESEAASYHTAGTCTFYGTANSNQMLMEIMGLHLPGASFVNPGTELREALTRAAAKRVTAITAEGNDYTPVGEIVDERAIVNGVVGLHATGGSTNHTMHLIAMAAAAGIKLTWDDMADLSEVVPLLTRVYPNGLADVNRFHEVGGMAYLIGQLLDAGLLHRDVRTVAGEGGLDLYRKVPVLGAAGLTWQAGPSHSADPTVLASVQNAFSANGGLKLLQGNLGRAVMKISAVKPDKRVVEAPVRVFADQDAAQAAFQAGDLDRDVVVVVRFQGPKANGMPELHKLTPGLSVLQDKGFKVALVTDGRMSGASGKVPAAIHLTPEALDGGPIARLRDGDVVRVDGEAGVIQVQVEQASFAARTPADADLAAAHKGVGRELFSGFRSLVSAADQGASVFA